jgi:hypothetical protein
MSYSENRNELLLSNSTNGGLVVDTNNYEKSVLNYLSDFGNETGFNDRFISGMVYIAQELQTNTKVQDTVLWSVIHKKIVERTEYNLDMNQVCIEIVLRPNYNNF